MLFRGAGSLNLLRYLMISVSDFPSTQTIVPQSKKQEALLQDGRGLSLHQTATYPDNHFLGYIAKSHLKHRSRSLIHETSITVKIHTPKIFTSLKSPPPPAQQSFFCLKCKAVAVFPNCTNPVDEAHFGQPWC